MKKYVFMVILAMTSMALAQVIDTVRFAEIDGAKYIGWAQSNNPRVAVCVSNAMWQIIKIDTNGVFNLHVDGKGQGRIAVWNDIETYAADADAWK